MTLEFPHRIAAYTCDAASRQCGLSAVFRTTVRCYLYAFCFAVLAASATPTFAQDTSENGETAREILARDEYRRYAVRDEIQDAGGSDFSEESVSPGDHESRARRRNAGVQPDEAQSRNTGGSIALSGIGNIIAIIAYIIIGLLIAGIVLAIVLSIINRTPRVKGGAAMKRTDDKRENAVPDAARKQLAVDLQCQYEEALRNQQFGLAVVLRFKLFWLAAGWNGCIEDEDVRTWRDALGLVRNGQVRQRVRRSLTLVERVRYAEHAPTAEEFRFWVQQVDAIDARAVLV